MWLYKILRGYKQKIFKKNKTKLKSNDYEMFIYILKEKGSAGDTLISRYYKYGEPGVPESLINPAWSVQPVLSG